MIVAAFIVAGFGIASVYAVAMLRGRRDRYHRAGFLLPFTVAAVLTPVQIGVGVLWGWGVGQYPDLLPGVGVDEAAATDAVLAATLGSLAVGALLLIPSLWWLYATFQRSRP